MATNRITRFLSSSTTLRGREKKPTAKGFETLSIRSFPGIQEDWNSLKRVYQFAWMLAQADSATQPPGTHD